jgi:PHD/YefM family antitoxin component YafN of YafNO toxin-antitoxin module
MKTQYITDNQGKKVAVILPVKDYEKIMDELDELHCVKAYDKAKTRKQEFIPAIEMFKAIEQKRKRN